MQPLTLHRLFSFSEREQAAIVILNGSLNGLEDVVRHSWDKCTLLCQWQYRRYYINGTSWVSRKHIYSNDIYIHTCIVQRATSQCNNVTNTSLNTNEHESATPDPALYEYQCKCYCHCSKIIMVYKSNVT